MGKISKAQKKISKIAWVVLAILLIILLVLNLSGCSNQTFERRALSFVQSNDIETYVVFHSQKNHLVLFKNAGDSLGVYDLKSQKHKSIGSTYSLGIQKAFPSATLFSERKMAINNVKSLYLTSNERNGVILVSEFVHDGGISEEVVTLILPDEEAFSELCRGSDIRIFNDNVIECYNYEKPSDFEYVSISKGEKVSTSHRYCGFLGNNASSLVNGSLIAVDSLLLGSFYTNNPYDRVSVCGTKKSYGDTNVKLKSIDGNSEIALESDFYMSHLKVSAIGLPNLPAQMELFDIKQTGDWEIGRYQDVMGNTLPEFYIWKSISSNGKKIGSFIIDKEGINIELFESYDTVPIHGHGTMNWIVQYGSRYDQFKFKSYNDRNGENRVSDSYFNNLLYILNTSLKI